MRVPRPALTAGRVVTCCVEDDWHTMPLRMLERGLVGHGHEVIALGPSVPSTELGAFLRDVRPAAALLAVWTNRPPTLLVVAPPDPEHRALIHPRPDLVQDCPGRLLDRRPGLLDDAGIAVATNHLATIIRVCAAASVTGDPSVLYEHVDWLDGLVARLGVHAATLTESYLVIAEVLGHEFPHTADLLASVGVGR